MRSLLFVPGDSERKLEKALSSEADVLIIDLEDSVSLRSKPLARQMAAEFITARRTETRAGIYVRVNDLSTGLTGDDLSAIVPCKPDGIMLPKSNSGADVQHLSAKLRVHEAEAGLAEGGIKIIPIITETAAGVLAAASYNNAGPRLAGLTWGAEDLSAALGVQSTRDSAGRYTDVFRLARALTVLAAAAAETAAIDTIFADFRDAEALKTECLEAARDGFTAKMAIHPAQVPIINQAFTPSADAVEEARAIVDAFSAADDAGVIAIEGRMYDIPHLRRAERMLARARSAGVTV